MSISYLDKPPLAVGAAAIYPYSDELLKELARTTKYGEPYTLGRVITAGAHRRILVPRRMAPPGGADLRTRGLSYKFKSVFKPRNEEQARLVKECVDLLMKDQNFMLSAPTGVGKTWLTTDVIARVGRKTLVVVNKEDIIDQWAIALNKCLGLGTLVKETLQDGRINESVQYNNGLGIIQADVCRVTNCGVVLAFVQSIAKDQRYPESMFKDFGLVVWDECHRIGADFFSQSALRVPAKLRLGVSATTERPDGKTEVMEAHIGPVMVSSEQFAETPKIVYTRSPWQCPQRPQLNQKTGKMEIRPIPHNAGKCAHVVKMLINHHGRNVKLCEFIAAAYKAGRHILVQSDMLEHLNILYSLLPNYGVPPQQMAAYVGGMSQIAREDAKLKRVILSTYMMTKEATDIPSLDTLVMATPKAQVEQIVGRILREHPGKKQPVVFDMADHTSPIFDGYWEARRKWYRARGFVIEQPLRVVKAQKAPA